MPASFLKAAVLNEESQAFSCAFENIFLQNTKKKTVEVNAKNERVTIIKQKYCKKFYAFDLIDNDV